MAKLAGLAVASPAGRSRAKMSAEIGGYFIGVAPMRPVVISRFPETSRALLKRR